MKNLKVKITDPSAQDFELENETILDEYLDLPPSHWSIGSGDSALWKDNSNGLMFFKIDCNSYFTMEISSYLSPIQNQDDIKWILHYIGGEPFFFSSRHLCSKETLLEILLEYAESGKVHKDFKWIDPIPNEELYFTLLNKKY
jgi:hypothetical protein